MKETSAHRLLRIARRIFIDLASDRIAARIAPDFLRAAKRHDDYGDEGGGRNFEKFTGRGGKGKGKSHGGKGYDKGWDKRRGQRQQESDWNDFSNSFKDNNDSDTPKHYELNHEEFDAPSNAVFNMMANNRGAGIYFNKWMSGSLTHRGNTFSASNAVFTLTTDKASGQTFMFFMGGTIEQDGNKYEIGSPTMIAIVNNKLWFRRGKESRGVINNATINSPANLMNVDVKNAKVNIGGTSFTAKDANFAADVQNGGLHLTWKGGTITSEAPNATGMFEHFTGKVRHGNAFIDCTDATFALGDSGSDALIDWKNGTWNDGVFTNGIWSNGHWKDGEWWYGYWRKGDWDHGWQIIPEKQKVVGKDGRRTNEEEYVWKSKSDLGPDNRKKIERTVPPTDLYKVNERIRNIYDSHTNSYQDKTFYDIDKAKTDAQSTVENDWTKDKDGNPLDPTLLPIQALDQLNSVHMYGKTSHKGRNTFMDDVAHMWKDPSNASQPADGNGQQQTGERQEIDEEKMFDDADDIYRTYYNNEGKSISLYVLYMNGRIKIFHIGDDAQKFYQNYHLLTPSTHRPATIGDLYMLKWMEVFDDFLPSPDGKIKVETHANDMAFPDFIVAKAVLASKFRVFDMNYMDNLFYQLDSNSNSLVKNIKAINDFKEEWENAVKEINGICKGKPIQLVYNKMLGEVHGLHKILIALEKLQNFLRNTSVRMKQNTFQLLNDEDKDIIRGLNKFSDVNGAWNIEDLEKWKNTSGPADPKALKAFDAIMARMKKNAIQYTDVTNNLK